MHLTKFSKRIGKHVLKKLLKIGIIKSAILKIYQFYDIKPEGTLGINDFEYLYMTWISYIFMKAINVPGHIVEIGVASGRNSIIFGKFLEISSEKFIRKYFGFDTFAGYLDDSLGKNPWLKADSWKGDIFKKKYVEQRVEDCGFSNSCTFIEGDCRKTIPEFLKNYSDDMVNKNSIKIAILYIDCNAYEPAFFSMKEFYPYLSPGGIIVIDETQQGGETNALFDFAEYMNLEVLHEKGSNPAYIMKPM